MSIILAILLFLVMFLLVEQTNLLKQYKNQTKELLDENSKLINYIDQNVGCATVCSDCSCGKKEMIE